MAYPSVYPTSLDSYTVNTDGIDDVMAVDVNELQSAIVAIETLLGIGGNITLAKVGNNQAASITFKPTTSAGAQVTSGIVSAWHTEGMVFQLPRDVATHGYFFKNNALATLMFIDSVSGNASIGLGPTKIGCITEAPTYGAIGLAGSLAATNQNFASAAADTNLYINRPTGRAISFKENNAADQMTLLTGGSLKIASLAGTGSRTVVAAADGTLSAP